MKILFLYNLTKDVPTPDDEDVLVQLYASTQAAEELGHLTDSFAVSLNLNELALKLDEYKPDLVFNLVEAISGIESYMHFVPLILEKQNIKFTGCSSDALYQTTNKISAKKIMQSANLPTPEWFTASTDKSIIDNYNKPFIVKPIAADASVGLDEDSVIRNSKKLYTELLSRSEKYGECFGEEYIDGREFNISIIEKNGLPNVLPIAEILFKNYPDGKEKVVGYTSKWNEKSFEYKNTVRSFTVDPDDTDLLMKLKKITEECWKVFNLSGYARVDYRVSEDGEIYILEVNANPCISPDAGFSAACNKAGYSYTKMIENIIKASTK